MRHILYYIAGFIIVVWAIFFTLQIFSWVIHMLLVIAAVIILIRVAQGKKMIE
jgi:hypothetical protein